jgi:vacuolar-type H+-ATPase subunit C/Vma6
MFNVEDILARLNKGETIESIAAEMTEALNEANEAYEAANAKATADAVLEAAAANLVSALLDYTNIACPELMEHVTEEDEEVLVDFLVSQAAELNKLAHVAIALGAPEVTKSAPRHAPTPDEILADFLKKNFLS